MTWLHTVSPYGPQAASTRVRVGDWLRHLGLSATSHTYRGARDNRPGSLMHDAPATIRAERAVRGLDLHGERVLLSREASPLGHGHLESRLLRGAGHGVYDFDDALFADDAGWRRVLGRRERCAAAVSAADVVLAGSDYLADWASGRAHDVRVIPSCVEPHDYRPRTDWAISSPRPRVVWLGSESTEAYLVAIAGALAEVGRRTGAELLVISGGDPNAGLASLEPMVRRVRWELGTVSAHLATADVAIAPLDDTAYSRGKCAYKMIQYAATGLPVVGSPVGANAVALQRFQGLAVASTDEWVDALVDVIEAPAARRESMGRAGLLGVRESYSFDAWAPAWRSAVLES